MKSCEKGVKGKTEMLTFLLDDITNVLWRYSPEKKGDITNVL